jgi:hypothetical protein
MRITLTRSKVWSHEAYLLYHYGIHTALSLPNQKEMQQTWQHWLPERALSQPFLMYGLTALSAFHLAHKSKPDQCHNGISDNAIWIALALKHQTKALEYFRSSLLDVTEQNCHDLFALANFLIIMSLTSSSFASTRSDLSMVIALEPLLLIRGTGEMLTLTFTWINVGPMARLIRGHVLVLPPDHVLPAAVAMRFTQLKSMLIETDSIEAQEALSSLQEIYHEASYSQVAIETNPGIVWKWAGTVSDNFVSLLKSSHPGALVVYAHWVILSQSLNDEWHFRGWAERALREISHVLDDAWKQWLVWPEEQMMSSLANLRS